MPRSKPVSQVLPQEQIRRFAEAARAIGADEDEDAFRAKLALIARQKPLPQPEQPVAAKRQKPRQRRATGKAAK